MKIKYLSFLVFIGMSLLQASTFITQAIDASTAIDTDAHFKACGLSPNPLCLSIQDEAMRADMEEFRSFHDKQKQLREKNSTYQHVVSFILGNLKVEPVKMSMLEPWISKAVGADPMQLQKRELLPKFDLLAELLSAICEKPISVNEIEVFLKERQIKQANTQRFLALKSFATTVLKFPEQELMHLSTLLLSDMSPTPIPEQFLKCRFDVPFKLVAARVQRDITQEFEQFEKDLLDRKSRIDLYEDLNNFFMQSASTPMAPSFQVMETMPDDAARMAIPKDCDPSFIVAQRKHNTLGSLLRPIDDRFRVVGRFIVCRQQNLTVEQAHADLHRETSVTFEKDGLYQDGVPLTTPLTQFGLNPMGILRIFHPSKSATLGGVNHSLFFQVDNVGMPLACAGYIEVKNGKITSINNNSGHYAPIMLQVILAVAYLHERGVVDENLTINHYTGVSSNLSLPEILNIAKMLQLTKSDHHSQAAISR